MARTSHKDITAAPVLDPVVLRDLREGDRYDLEPRADLEGFEFADLRLDDVDLSYATVYGSRFVNVRAAEADLPSVRLGESVVERLDVPVLRGVRGTWRDIEIRNARIGSAELYESVWHAVHFVGCKLGFVNLRGAELQDVAFTDCTVDELDLVQATASRVRFTETRVRSLDVQASMLEHVDLRGAHLAELRGIESLRGATIDPAQLALLAPVFATALGIVVAD